MIAVLVGLQAEARLVKPGRVACSGGVPDRARLLARQLLEEGAEGLVSFGIAGGLAPGLIPGSLVVASGVEVRNQVLSADAQWCRRLLARLPKAQFGVVHGGEVVAATPGAKARLRAGAQAVAVDLESAAVAETCTEAGKPFAVLRAVADPYDRGIPASALVGLDENGDTRPLAVMQALLRRPQDLPGLIRVGLDTKAALQALDQAVRALGPALGFEAA
jgi:adenosylhomocysteine nucleosidase